MSFREEIRVLLFGLVFLAIYGLEFIQLTGYLVVRIRRGSWRNIRVTKFDWALHAMAAVVLVCILYGHFIEPRWIDVHTETLTTPKLKTASFRIVQISDLHCDREPRNERRMVEIVNSLKPDIVVATGDYLNDVAGLTRLRESLSRIEAPFGKFAVTGNFEVRHWPDLDVLADSTFRVLDSETVLVTKGEDTIAISGMGFIPSDAPHEAFEGFSKDRFDVFLFHTPDLVEDFANRGIDLYLCGHTHGGQISLPWYGALITFSKFDKKYESGLHQVGDTVLFVNRGLGMEPRPAPQIRFCARPQIAVFDIRPK